MLFGSALPVHPVGSGWWSTFSLSSQSLFMERAMHMQLIGEPGIHTKLLGIAFLSSFLLVISRPLESPFLILWPESQGVVFHSAAYFPRLQQRIGLYGRAQLEKKQLRLYPTLSTSQLFWSQRRFCLI